MDALSALAATGTANRLSRNMAYTLFGNVVDYDTRYRGIRSVILHEHEASAEVELEPEAHGAWHTPPHWIDSVLQLAGLVMNGSDVSNTRDFFYITPGCESFRLARILVSGGKYRTYVRMFPTSDSGMYAGDVYIFQDGEVIGMAKQIRFRRVPRLLMNQLISSPPAPKGDGKSAKAVTGWLPVADNKAKASNKVQKQTTPLRPESLPARAQPLLVAPGT